MQVCLMVEGQEDVAWEQWIGLAEACERHGLYGLFRSDHYLSVIADPARASLDAWTTIAALGSLTSRIRLGTLVSPVTFRPPSVLAKAVTTADHISQGRVELGMGAGWHEPEHTAFGFPFPETRVRLDLLAEQLEIIVRQWTEDVFTFDGANYHLDECRALPKPVQQPHPPIIVGGHGGPRSVAIAARWADEYNTLGSSLAECTKGRAVLEAAWERAGRDPGTVRMSVMSPLVLGSGREDLLARTRRLIDRLGRSDDPGALLDDRRDTWTTGTVSEVVDRLGELAAAGVDRIVLQHFVHDDLETIALLGEEVVPAVGR